MALYGGSVQSVQASNITSTALADLKAAPTGGTKLLEVWVLNPSAGGSQSNVALGRSTAELFQSFTNYLSSYDTGDKPTTTSLGIVWSSAPVVPTQMFRRGQWLGNGGGIVWAFPRGISIAASQSIIVWGISAAGINAGHNVSVEVDE